VVVIPLVALKTDLVRRCREAGINYSVWAQHTDPQKYVGSPLLFVSVEQAVRQPFRRFLGQLDASEGLDRVVFDEAHLILTARQYRPKMALVRHLRNYRCQVVF
jgi:superfamily II DNA helicase RecQ